MSVTKPVIVTFNPAGNLEITSVHQNTGSDRVIIERADMFEAFVAIRDLLDDVICLECGGPQPKLGRRCQCWNDE